LPCNSTRFRQITWTVDSPGGPLTIFWSAFVHRWFQFVEHSVTFLFL
jgi:hypothetical protein